MSGDRYVDTVPALAEVVAACRAEPLIAVDTEAASFHRFLDRVYLIQLSTRSTTVIIDPLPFRDLAPLGDLLAESTVEKVFHDADYDLRILDRDYGFRPRHLFDTRIAAQLAGEQAIGLAALLEKYVGVKLSKAHQRADWSQRPLPPDMLAYAAADTRHLPALRDSLRARLLALHRLAWVEEEFERLEDLRWSGGGPADAAEAFLRIKGARTLMPRQLAALRALVAWRDGVAAAQDRATFRIVGNEALLAVSRVLPRSAEALAAIHELPASLARRHGSALLESVERALALPEHDLPRRERVVRFAKDPDLDARVERLKGVRDVVARQLGLDPGVLCGKTTLEIIARAHPMDRAGLTRIAELRRWQVETLGDALLRALGGGRPPTGAKS